MSDAPTLELAAAFTLRTGEAAQLRVLLGTDARLLGEFFIALSAHTVSLYAPHPFDQVTADRLCAETSTDTTQVRLVVATGDGSTVQLVAYFILGFELHASDTKRYLERGMPLHSKTDVSLAPVVADEYQSTGVGSLIMAEVLPWLRRRGTKRLLLLGGVRAQNTRAIRFYEKWGMQRVGEFTTSAPCYDMIADLNAEQPHNRPAR